MRLPKSNILDQPELNDNLQFCHKNISIQQICLKMKNTLAYFAIG